MAVSTALPPEPNLDATAVATLQGTGGAACVAGAAYPNIVVGGVTVGTGLGPAPVKDASGFYHFKPSCYGYLNIAPLSGGGISNVQVGPETVPTKHFITPTLAAASLAGTLLVAVMECDPSPNRVTAPAPWTNADFAFAGGNSRSELWYYPNNPGGVTNVTLTATPASIACEAQLTEWRNVAAAAPLDQTGTATVTSNALTATVSTGGATTAANELVITSDALAAQAGMAISPGAGWTSLVNDPTNGLVSEYRLDLAAGIASETLTSTSATTVPSAPSEPNRLSVL